MEINKRVTTCRLIELMNENEKKSKKLGLKNISTFKRNERKEVGKQ